MSLLAGVGLLKPVIALNLWTFTVEAWMYAYRIPAISQYKLKMTPQDAKKEMTKLPAEVQWPAENYNHLMEQPTQFYAVAITSVLLGLGDDPTMVRLAWAYVVGRFVHSVVQCTSNIIMLRFSIFAVTGLTLLGMTVKAATFIF